MIRSSVCFCISPVEAFRTRDGALWSTARHVASRWHVGGEVCLWQKPLYSACLLPTCSSEAVDARSAALRSSGPGKERLGVGAGRVLVRPGEMELCIGSSGDPRGDPAHVVSL